MRDTKMLEEFRSERENGLEPKLRVDITAGGFMVVMVVLVRELETGQMCYRLHRYFTIGDRWVVSVDCSNARSQQEVLEMLQSVSDRVTKEVNAIDLETPLPVAEVCRGVECPVCGADLPTYGEDGVQVKEGSEQSCRECGQDFVISIVDPRVPKEEVTYQ